MDRRFFLGMVAAGPMLALSAGVAQAADDYRISGPAVHENLAIFFIHGTDAGGPAPVTLQEALSKGAVRVIETGNVNQLDIENLGGEEVFVQSGDIVKGGQQDRVLSVSLLLPPRSGRIPIGAFCVEQGRWSARGKEDAKGFSSAYAAVPSREAKIALKQTDTPYRTASPDRADASTSGRQRQVWTNVSKIQEKLAGSLGAGVASPQSATSLQLTLENDKLKTAQSAYLEALQPAGEKDPDIIGYVFAINGKLNSADLYPSNSLFRKMWPKLLSANATEAIGERAGASEAPPPIDTVKVFLDAARRGDIMEREVIKNVRLEKREDEKTLYFETRRSDGRWVHRNYLAK
jgi:hypothetical protein